MSKFYRIPDTGIRIRHIPKMLEQIRPDTKFVSSVKTAHLAYMSSLIDTVHFGKVLFKTVVALSFIGIQKEVALVSNERCRCHRTVFNLIIMSKSVPPCKTVTSPGQ